MAHLNYFHTRFAGFNFCFFISVPSGGRCWYYAKFEMLLRKIDGELTCKIVDILRNCEMETVATCSMTDGNVSCHGLALSFFEVMTHCRRQKLSRRWTGNPNGRSKFHKYRVYLPILCLFTSMRSRLLLRNWRQRQLPQTHAVVFRRDDTCL